MLYVHDMHTLVCRVFKWKYEQLLYGQTFLPTDIRFARTNAPLNNLIKINNKHIFKKTWVKKGIFFVNELIDENGNIYSKQTLCEKYNLPVTFLEYYGIIAAIPIEWKNTVKGCNKLENVSCKNVVYLRDNQKVTKYFTKLLIERLKPDTISSKTKWDIKLNLVLDDDKWVKINNQTFQLSDDTLLCTFQYKINNRILYTNDKLYIFKLTDTELCSFCTETKKTFGSVILSKRCG